MNPLVAIEKKLVHNFWLLPPDLHERQRVIGQRIPNSVTILDVGGEQPILENNEKVLEYYTINIADDINQTPKYMKNPQKHMVYDGKHLPFSDQSFDVVVSIDVLEHVPGVERLSLIKEMVRVSKKMVICSAPLGTKAHIQAEKELLASITDAKEAEFLKDHIEKVLPTPSDVEAWAKKLGGNLEYSGDYRWANWLYAFQRKELPFSFANHLFFLCKLLFYGCLNLFLYPLIVGKKEFSEHTNRFYLLVSK